MFNIFYFLFFLSDLVFLDFLASGLRNDWLRDTNNPNIKPPNAGWPEDKRRIVHINTNNPGNPLAIIKSLKIKSVFCNFFIVLIFCWLLFGVLDELVFSIIYKYTGDIGQ